MKYILTALLMFPALSLASTAKATLSSPTMKKLNARVELTEVPEGIKIVTTASGLKPGSVHGYHVHETGKCEGPDFKSAGGHFNPKENKHGGPAAGENHMGDLGNLIADKKGVAQSEVIIRSASKETLSQYVGKSVIIHANADDMMSQPSGDSGDRIACGVISGATLSP